MEGSIDLRSAGGRRGRGIAAIAIATRPSLAAVGLALAVLFLPLTGQAAGYTIQARNYEFVAPGGGSALTVTVGDAVTWQASGDPHTVTSGTPGAVDNRFDDHPASVGLLLDGDSFSTTFTSPGTYPFFCEIHPEQMSGTITVVAAATPAPTPAPTPGPTRAPTPKPTPVPTPPPTVPPPTAPPATSPSSSPVASRASLPPSATPIPSPTATPSSGTTPIPSPSAEGSAASGAAGGSALPIVIIVLAAAAALGGLTLARRRRAGR